MIAVTVDLASNAVDPIRVAPLVPVVTVRHVGKGRWGCRVGERIERMRVVVRDLRADRDFDPFDRFHRKCVQTLIEHVAIPNLIKTRL